MKWTVWIIYFHSVVFAEFYAKCFIGGTSCTEIIKAYLNSLKVNIVFHFNSSQDNSLVWKLFVGVFERRERLHDSIPPSWNITDKNKQINELVKMQGRSCQYGWSSFNRTTYRIKPQGVGGWCVSILSDYIIFFPILFSKTGGYGPEM